MENLIGNFANDEEKADEAGAEIAKASRECDAIADTKIMEIDRRLYARYASMSLQRACTIIAMIDDAHTREELIKNWNRAFTKYRNTVQPLKASA